MAKSKSNADIYREVTARIKAGEPLASVNEYLSEFGLPPIPPGPRTLALAESENFSPGGPPPPVQEDSGEVGQDNISEPPEAAPAPAPAPETPPAPDPAPEQTVAQTPDPVPQPAPPAPKPMAEIAETLPAAPPPPPPEPPAPEPFWRGRGGGGGVEPSAAASPEGRPVTGGSLAELGVAATGMEGGESALEGVPAPGGEGGATSSVLEGVADADLGSIPPPGAESEGKDKKTEQTQKEEQKTVEDTTDSLKDMAGMVSKVAGMFGPYGKAVGAAIETFVALEVAAIGFVSGIEGMAEAALQAQEHLREFSGQINDTFAMMEIQELQLAQQSAASTGGTTKALGGQLMALKEEFQPVKDALINVKNFVMMIFVLIARGLTFIIKAFSVLFHIGRLLEWLFGGAAEDDKPPAQIYAEMMRDVGRGAYNPDQPHMGRPGHPHAR